MSEWVSLSRLRVTRWSVQDMLAQPTIQVVIISNQSGIHRGKMTIDDWRTKATRIKEKLGIPLQVVEYHPAQIEVVFEQTVGVKKLAIYWERKNVERQFSHNYQRSIDFTIGNIFITVDLLQMLVCPRDCIRKSRDKKIPAFGRGMDFPLRNNLSAVYGLFLCENCLNAEDKFVANDKGQTRINYPASEFLTRTSKLSALVDIWTGQSQSQTKLKWSVSQLSNHFAPTTAL